MTLVPTRPTNDRKKGVSAYSSSQKEVYTATIMDSSYSYFQSLIQTKPSRARARPKAKAL